MRESTVAAYAAVDIDLYTRERYRKERKAGAYGRMMVVDSGNRAFVDYRAHHPTAGISFEQSPGNGRSYWMTRKMRFVLMYVKDEVRHGRTLHVKQIAAAAGVSPGYASKVIARLGWWRFIEVVSTTRGRWGGIVARAAQRLRQKFNVSSVLPKGLSTATEGGNIKLDAASAALIRRPWTAAELTF